MKASLAKGTRDFGPQTLRKRQFVINCISAVFERYGYAAIETPAIENLSTLLGKYGEEGDQLMFRILNSGDFLAKAKPENISKDKSKELMTAIAEKGLRYDLTIPFARFVVMNQNDISFPFKRYQIQSVWRADRPQKGRYREFVQCDADVIGSTSLLNEIELSNIYIRVFKSLNLDVSVRISNRKVLTGLVQDFFQVPDQLIPFTTILDKLDKVGMDKVRAEWLGIGLAENKVEAFCTFLKGIPKLNNEERLIQLGKLLTNSGIGRKGLDELAEVLKNVEDEALVFDPSLARGLNYYTGCIWEAWSKEVKMGSLGGGGRYDDLTGLFGLKDMSGVGISFGLDRICDVLEDLNRFPETILKGSDLLIVNFEENDLSLYNSTAENLRNNGIQTEVYPDSVKLKKQFKYANDQNIAFVVMMGEDEKEKGKVLLKNMDSGEQEAIRIEELILKLKNGDQKQD